MKKIAAALIGATLMFGVVGCTTTPEVTGPTAEELEEQRRQAELAERLAREEAERLAREAAEAERLAAEEAARRAEAARLAELQRYGAPGSKKEFATRAGERVFFDVDQWRLDDEDKAVLQRQASWLQQYPSVRLIVAGNCDERGTREYNIGLGERRASVVRDYLVSLGVDADRIETTSNGKDRPWKDGSGPQIWAQNRNGHTQLVSGFVSES